MRSAASFDIVNHAEAISVDDAHAVGQAVGREHAFPVGRDGDAPGAAPHVLGDCLNDFVVGNGDDVHGVRAAARHVDAVAVRGDGHLHRAAVQPQVDGVNHFECFRVDDAHGAADLGGHVDEGAVRRELHFPGTVADEDVLDDRVVLDVVHGGRVGRFC